MTWRWLVVAVAASIGLAAAAPPCVAADVWGGSVGLTSDYVVRGISRSDQTPALQLDAHYFNSAGFLAGVFASNTEIASGESRDAELDGFIGFVWSAGKDWHGKILYSHYAYPWNELGSSYDYDEIAVDAAYSNWLSVSATYSPNAPRYVPGYGIEGVAAQSGEVDLQHAVIKKLTATAGAGYSHFGGPNGQGYGYFSVGAAYDLAPVTLTLSYVNTTAAAKTLFYNEAERGRVLAMAIWRF